VYAVVRLTPDDAVGLRDGLGALPAATPKARSLDAHVTEPCRIDHGQHNRARRFALSLFGWDIST